METLETDDLRVRQSRNYLGIVSSSIDRLVLVRLHVTSLARYRFSFRRIEPTGSHRMDLDTSRKSGNLESIEVGRYLERLRRSV